MEDPSVEWKIQEFPSKSNSSSSKVSLILNKGWSLGKTIVITGMAISSAPFVLPPLLVFSTLGFAFSVPFGLVFASYACTEKIMSKFLSNPIPPPMLENENLFADKEVMEGDEDVEFEVGGEPVAEEARGFEGNLLENENKPLGESNRKITKRKNEDSVPKKEVKPGEEIEGRKDETSVDNIVQEEKPAGETMKMIDESKDGGIAGKMVEKEKKPMVEMKAMMQGGRVEDNVSAGKEHSSDSISKGSADSVEHPVSSNIPKSTLGVASQKKMSVPPNKVLYTEEKVWEQIDTIRTIVGYKAPRLVTCTEELKALYVYTGVEPPASLKDPSDLVEVGYKLRFLMSIVGVK